MCRLVECGSATGANASFVNFETAPVHPVALSSAGDRLAICNLPDGRLELFDVRAGVPVPNGSVPVGVDPVSVRFRTPTEAWVVNQISDSISVVDVPTLRVIATLDTGDAPADVVFAGNPERAWVSCAGLNAVEVFDPVNRTRVHAIPLAGQRPRAMATRPDRTKVFVAIFESGNRSTILSGSLPALTNLAAPSVVDFPSGPYGGQNPPPNQGTNFTPPINATIPTNIPPPRVGLIVKRNASGRWLDGNQGDWTEFVSGTNAVFSGRAPGWDLADHDVAVIDPATQDVAYLSGLMNICMDLAVNPASGRIAVVGTDAMNEVRFEPMLRGRFVRVELALADPATGSATVRDLNPHLDYLNPTLAESERARSIGDPRGIVWNEDGSRGYIVGMGSDNLLVIDREGNRVGRQPPLTLGEGPAGLALDTARRRVYVWNRFSASLSVVDTTQELVVTNVPLFDPTPPAVRAGRKHFYNTHNTSGLGQGACASCHLDARFDRLAWDLGDPLGEAKIITRTNANFGRFPPDPTNHFHPFKGPMVTQTLQDIIGHEPFHWRGDRDGLEQFNGTFTNLQGAAVTRTPAEMAELKEFLATIRFPPNPHRLFNNGLSVNLALPGHRTLGRGVRPAGIPLPAGNARAGLTRFLQQGNAGCIHCHTLPSGLGTDSTWTGVSWQRVPAGPNGERHAALMQVDRSRQLPFKISQLRNLHDKLGMDSRTPFGQAGFGFLHDGSVDTLVRLLQDGFDFRDDQATADLVAFLLSITGSDLPAGVSNDPDRSPGLPGGDVAAAVGRQVTLDEPTPVPLIAEMIALASSPTGRVDLVVHGGTSGAQRGWFFDRISRAFLSDRNGESTPPETVLALGSAASPLTCTIVSRETGRRIGIDRDEDGYFNLTEIEFGSDPTDPLSLATNRPRRSSGHRIPYP